MDGRARPAEQASILAAVLAAARGAAPAGVVVFDLDSTLLDNRPRQARILRDYGRRAGLAPLAGARPEHVVSWDLADAMRRAGCSPLEVARHLLALRRFWAATFFTSEYCREDVPVPGAPAFAREVAAAGAQVGYVTGRPRRMEAGTLDVFRRCGLPLPDGRRVHLFMKPEAPLGDDAWKALAAARVEALGPVVAAFDNEPAHVNGYALRWPRARCVHLDTDHSARPVAVLPHVPSIADFRLGPPAAAAAG
ncbi:MAG TPA: HAD family hydrolase [Anaeromyxobacteraceae bacterium]|nr:HAD family hydrolase [Anaeromyxobacteraceae bacterium]